MDRNVATEYTDIVLVNMPFDTFNVPSPALGLLKAEAVRRGLKAEVIYANHYFARSLGIDRFRHIQTAAGIMLLVVECIFQPYAGYESIKSIDEIIDFYKNKYPQEAYKYEFLRNEVLEIWKNLDEFLDNICDMILSKNPRIVGATYSLQQCNANLALFKRLKEKCPEIICVMGGSSCSVNASKALIKHMPQVDYIFVGESDDIFAPALRMMANGEKTALREYPFIVQEGTFPEAHAVADMNDICYPDHDDYFKSLDELDLRRFVKVMLPIEGSRGCWWGEKHKCKFCGLCNSPETLKYRMKTPERIAREVDYLADRYKIKEFCFTDCVLDPIHIKEFPQLFKDKGYHFFAEVKSNTTFEALAKMREVGFLWLQPGIEALQDDLLIHMNKGNRAIKHIEYLKWAKILGIMIFWNQLMGFPGEDDNWYYESAKLYPLIVHLGVPSKAAFMYQRNSIFTIEQEKYGVHTTKCDYYEYLFGENEEFLDEFAEFLEDRDREMPYWDEIEASLSQWFEEISRGATLTYFVDRGYMGIHDTRSCTSERKVVLMGLEKQICLCADSVIKISNLYEMIDGSSKEEIDEALNSLIIKKLIIKIKDEILFLALPRGYEKNNPNVDVYVGRI